MGGRPLPLGCGGPRARPRFRQVSSIVRRGLTKPRGGRPTTRDPGQDLQSLPLLYAMHVTLPTPDAWCAWFVCRVMLVCCALCAQVRRRVSRAEERRGRWTLTGPTCLSVFLPACLSCRIPKWASQTRFVNSTAGETGLRNSPQRAGIACLIMSASSALSVHLLSPFGASHLITALRP